MIVSMKTEILMNKIANREERVPFVYARCGN